MLRAVPKPANVIVVSPDWPGWRWNAAHIPEVEWHFFHDAPRGALEAKLPQQVVRLRACLEVVRAARRLDAVAIFAHGHEYAIPCIAALRALGLKIPVVVVAYNYVTLPRGARLQIARTFLPHADRLIVASTMERELYSRLIGIPIERLEMLRWCVDTPEVEPAEPVEKGEYVCAIGGNARDYATLITAARSLPDIRFVVVVRPGNLDGLEMPANIAVHTNVSPERAMNILYHSRFMVLTLPHSEVPCGHVTLVSALHLSKPFIVTSSTGVADYQNGTEHSIGVPPADPVALANAIQSLWDDPARCQTMGEKARRFAVDLCSVQTAVAYLRRLLDEYGAFSTRR
jgi:glycosyltransferase involved in cell wall biosynthesis